MKIKKNNLPSIALAAFGVFLGRGAQADTTIDFDTYPTVINVPIPSTFGDAASTSSEGITVNGFGTPNINLTWQGTGTSWQFYIDSVWTAGQLDSSSIGDMSELVFTPNVGSVSAVIKSFNFHPYYDSLERYTYSVSILAGATVVSGPFTNTFQADSTKIPVSLNYTGAVGQALTLRLHRIPSVLGGGEVNGGSGNIAVDDIVFAQLPETEFPVGPQVLTVSPVNNQVGVAPDILYRASITNGSTSLSNGTIALKFNGSTVSPTITEQNGLSNVTYQAATLLPPGSTNKFTLTYQDTEGKKFTNEVQYVVANYVDIKLPAPIVFQDFNGTPEGTLPPGWTSFNLDTIRDPTSEPELNPTNLDSAFYTNWVVVEAYRFTNTFDTYSDIYNGLTPTPGYAEDYQRVLALNSSNVVNGVFLRNLTTGRLAFGNSGYRLDALGQVLYMYTPDFNLTGQSNVYVSFHSLWEQNQDSIGSLEYSIDLGVTWRPVVYLLDRVDVATNLDGTIDALSTFTNAHTDAAYYVDAGVTNGGYYGAFIGVASNQWSTLAPYISPRVDDSPTESKRVEIFRLPLADNQATVRFRFAYAGGDSWYWGVDDFGLYSLPALTITSIVRSGSNVIISWNGAAGTKLQKTTSLTSPNWQDVAGSNGASSATEPASGTAFYRLSRPY